MTSSNSFIGKHAVLIYFILAFIISWGAIYAIAGPQGIPATKELIMALGMAILLGPSVAGILLTGLVSGRSGYRNLASRLFRGRVHIRWYVVALLTAPIVTILVMLIMGLFSSGYHPAIFGAEDKTSLVMMGIMGGITVGFFEELGWSGFAIPRMKPRFGIFTTGIIVGLLWGAWHFLLFWENDSFSKAFPFALLMVRLFSWLPAYRILMIWVYDRTESLLVVIFMHVSLVVTMLVIDPVIEGKQLLTFILVRAAVLWIIAIVITLYSKAVNK